MRCCDGEHRKPATGDKQTPCQRENPNRKRPSSEECEDTKRDRSKQRKGDGRRSRGVESSKRFSVRVMEAMRALQRQKEAQAKGQTCGPPCSSVCEIVDYVTENFCTNGDLDAQVRTALKRTCCQGFVKYERNDAYRLVDPFVCQLMKTQQANSTTSMSSLTARRCIHDPCEENNNNNNNDTPYNRNGAGDSDQVQDSSENELSLPSSAADDVLWRRMQNQNSNQNNNSGGDRACPSNPRSCNQNRNQDPCSSNQNRNQNPCSGNQNQNQPPRCGGPCSSNQNQNEPPRCGGPCNAQPNQSSAAGSGASGRVATPAGELEVSFSNGDDDDDDDDGEESGGENGGRNGANEEVEQDDEGEEDGEDEEDEEDEEEEEDEEAEEDEEEEEDDEEEEEGDNASEDSVLHELDIRNRRPKDGARDKELKRWIRQCRKECERQAQQRQAQQRRAQ